MEIAVGNGQKALVLLQLTDAEAGHRLAKAWPYLLATELQSDVALLGDPEETDGPNVVLLRGRVHGRCAALDVDVVAVELHLRDMLLLGPLLVGLVKAVAKRHFFLPYCKE